MDGRSERVFLQHALRTGADGRLLFPELIYAAIDRAST
jgi:hypothetical protein